MYLPTPSPLFFVFLLTCVTLVLGGLWLSKKIGLLDKPHLYADTRWTRWPVPTVQGLFLRIIAAIVVSLFFPHLRFTNHGQAVLIGSLFLMVSGFIDDCAIGIRLPTVVRFGIQLLIAVGAVWRWDLSIWHITRWTNTYYSPAWLGMSISVMWFIVCINAMNFFDGVHGQASATSTIWFTTTWLIIKVIVLATYTNILPNTISILSNIQELALVFAVLAGTYAIVEWKPRGLVRDAGTLVYGFVLAYLALAGGAKIGTMVVVLSLVIFDAIRVALHRLFILHKPIWKGDFTHLHHRLLVHGWTKKEINVAMTGRSVMMMILMLLQGDNKRNKIIIFVMMAIVFFGINAYIFRYKKKPAWLPSPKDT